MKNLLSVAEAAKRLGITPQAVRNLIDQGRLLAFKAGAGRAWIISEDALARVERRPAGWPLGKKRKVSE